MFPMDYKYKNNLVVGEELTEDEIRVIATRYNRGPDLSLEEIMQNTSYGNQILENKTDIENALKE